MHYHTKSMMRKAQYRRYRDYCNLNSDNLMHLIDQSNKLKTAFNSLNPDEVADKIVMEFNKILKKLAPSKTREIRKDDMKYIDENINDMKKEEDNMLTKAINIGDLTDWQISKYIRNKTRGLQLCPGFQFTIQ